MKKLLLCASLLGGMLVNAQTFTGGTMLGSSGTVPISIDLEVDKDTQVVNCVFKGPSSKYYAVGFDAREMADAPYIFFTQEGTVQERKLTGARNAGNLLESSITITSDEVDENDMRTIVFSRPLTVSENYFDFSNVRAGSVFNLIWAEGSSLDIMRHSRRGTSSVVFLNGTSLSVDDVTQSDSSYIQLYPNPVETILTVSNYEKLSLIEVYDTKYSKIASYDPELIQGKVDMSALASGMYFVKCVGFDDTSVSEMIIKK